MMATHLRDLLTSRTDRENGAVVVKPRKALASHVHRQALHGVENKLGNAVQLLKGKAELTQKDNRLVLQKKLLVPTNVDAKVEKSTEENNVTTLPDPDIDCRRDPQMVSEYLGDIMNYLRELESKFPIETNFLMNHSTSKKNRAILVDWLVQVHSNFKFALETLYLCVSFVDRYLQANKKVGRETLQLVGAAALFVAGKYEEIYMPDISDFVYICDDAFSKRQIFKMEQEILYKLNFNLGRPLPICFLRRYSKLASAKPEEHNLAKYLLELSLIECELSHIKPSILAAAACYLALSIWKNNIVPSEVWTAVLQHGTTYKYPQFKTVVISLAVLLKNAKSSKYQTVQNKYESSKLGKISAHTKLSNMVVNYFVKQATVSAALTT